MITSNIKTKRPKNSVQMLRCKCGEVFAHYYAPIHRCQKPRKMVDGDLYG